MDASKPTHPSGENVTDAQLYDQILSDTVRAQIDSICDQIGRHELPNDLEGMEKTIRRARLQLELVESMIATRREELNDDE